MAQPKALYPRAVKVMAEAGMDISGQRAKGMEAVKGIDFDYVVTLCGDARETCPVFPGKVKIRALVEKLPEILREEGPAVILNV